MIVTSDLDAIGNTVVENAVVDSNAVTETKLNQDGSDRIVVSDGTISWIVVGRI